MPGLLQAFNVQDCIGGLASFEGCIAVEGAGVQEAHFIWLGRRNTGKRWATSLVLKRWELRFVNNPTADGIRELKTVPVNQ